MYNTMPAKGVKKTEKQSQPDVVDTPKVDDKVVPVVENKPNITDDKKEQTIQPQSVQQEPVQQNTEPVIEEVKSVDNVKKPIKKKKTVQKKKALKTKSKTSKKKIKATPKNKKSKKIVKRKARVAKKKHVEEMKISDITEPRYFKLIYGDQETGRFSGSKPKQAANKALTSIVKLKEKNGEPAIDVDIDYSLKECTRWNKKKCKKGAKGEKIVKVYKYVGKRIHLDNQVPVDHKQEDTDETILKSGKITKELPLQNGNMKYYIERKNKVKGTDGKMKDVTENIIVKKYKVSTGEIKYSIVNEIKYKFTNKVQKKKTV